MEDIHEVCIYNTYTILLRTEYVYKKKTIKKIAKYHQKGPQRPLTNLVLIHSPIYAIHRQKQDLEGLSCRYITFS